MESFINKFYPELSSEFIEKRREMFDKAARDLELQKRRQARAEESEFPLPLVLEISKLTIGFDLAPLSAMSDEEYKEWAKDHVRTFKDINGKQHTIVSGDPFTD